MLARRGCLSSRGTAVEPTTADPISMHQHRPARDVGSVPLLVCSSRRSKPSRRAEACRCASRDPAIDHLPSHLKACLFTFGSAKK